MRQKHTPGEWYSQVMGGNHDIDIYPGDTGKSIALVRGADDEAKANARLIENAPELLPTQSGFFFGGTDYDEYYFQDIDRTIEIIEALLKEKEEGQEYLNGDIYYLASW